MSKDGNKQVGKWSKVVEQEHRLHLRNSVRDKRREDKVNTHLEEEGRLTFVNRGDHRTSELMK